jgi:hypothetical protein
VLKAGKLRLVQVEFSGKEGSLQRSIDDFDKFLGSLNLIGGGLWLGLKYMHPKAADKVHGCLDVSLGHWIEPCCDFES